MYLIISWKLRYLKWNYTSAIKSIIIHNHNNIMYLRYSYLSLKLHSRDFRIKRYNAR